mmetsp:Transcript_6996/g.9668  ORF Transcript_6996/g.9668 Transcript_6996/m.9668 type:complete len:442 (+) Transcript_6996:140-1465(+)
MQKETVEKAIISALKRGKSAVQLVDQQVNKFEDFMNALMNIPMHNLQVEDSWVIIEEGLSESLIEQNEEEKLNQFLLLLGRQVVDLDKLRKMSWSGIPVPVRPTCWKLLLGYIPADLDLRQKVLKQKRLEYAELHAKYYVNMSDSERETSLHQIQLDVPRTIPKGYNGNIFKNDKIRLMLEHIMYNWAAHHPQIGYFQGLSDIISQFIIVFLSHYVFDVEEVDFERLPPNALSEIEADTFWCITLLLQNMENYYTNNLYEGVAVMMDKLKGLVTLIDPQLAAHFESQNVEYIHFCVRWILCIFTRELPFHTAIRLFDSYLAEGACFSALHVYVCAAFLQRWSSKLKSMEFVDILVFLQHTPTDDWTPRDAERLIISAYSIGLREKAFMDYCMSATFLSTVMVFFMYLSFASFTMTLLDEATKHIKDHEDQSDGQKESPEEQ